MKAYYSIVSIATSPQLNEKFNIGLLCVTPEDTYFHFSEKKFTIISKLLSENGGKLALSALNGIDNQISKAKLNKLDMFSTSNRLHAVEESYLGYLSRYNNNLLQFSNATEIDLTIDHTVFKALFKKYIFSDEIFETIIKPKNTFTTFRNNFKKAASPYANTNFDVTGEIICNEKLVVPVKVDVFGKNGSFVTAQSLDFGKPIGQLNSETSSYLYLTEKTLEEDKNTKSFILGDEPSEKERENHDLWKAVLGLGFVEFVPTDESDRVIDYMKIQGVTPVV